MKRKEKKYQRGFTLVELLATVVIITVVGGIAATVYLANIKRIKEQSTLLAINNVKSAAELFSKDNANSINWIYSYDAGGNNITGQYACISVLQLINQGYFKKDFFKKDIYEDQLNNNSLITIKKGINANDYETGIYNESDKIDQCELSMMNKVLKKFQIDDKKSYSDRIYFDVSVKNKRVESNNFIFNYGLPNSETLNHTGTCSGGKDCLMDNLDKKTSYKVQICLNTGEENICEPTTFNTEDIKSPEISFTPPSTRQPRYYYRDVVIKYDPTTIYEGVAQRYFKTEVNGKLKNNVDVYQCSNYEVCSNTKITNNTLNANTLYKLVGSDIVSFTITEDATNKKVYAYLRDSKNESTKEQTIPPIKTTFNVNYSGGNGATGSVSSHTCKYNNNCTLNTNGFTKPGYQFVSWRYNGETVNNPLNQTTMLNDDSMTLVAYWNTISYTINYNLDGGTHGSSHPTTGSFNNLVTISNPTKSGKIFTGWTSSTSSGLGSSAKTGTTNNPSTAWTGTATKNTYFKNLRDQTGTVTLTANWSNTNYTISYDLRGGTHGSSHPTTGSVGGVVTISNPIKLGYTFSGWTSSTSSGLGSSAKTGTTNSPSTAWTGTATKNTYFKDLRSNSGTVTLTANWTRNFTCAAAGSNTDYMGRSWYTNSNDGTYCDLSLNDKVGASEGNSYDDATGTGNKSVYNYIKGFNANGLEAEYNAGLITQIDTNAGHNGSPSGVFWEGNATVYNSTGTAYYSYSQPSYKNITSGYNYYNYNTLNTGSTDIDFDDEGVGNSEKTFNLKGLASNTLSGTTVIGTNSSKTVSSGSSISYNTYTYSSVSTGNNSEYMTDFNDMTGLSGEDKRNVSFSSNSCGSYWGIPLLNYACSSDVTSACNKSSGRSYKWVFYSCGGGNATKSISLEIKNNTHFYYGNEATGKTGSNRPEWRYGYTRDYTFAGRTSATNSISGCDTKTKKNTRTYNFNNNTTYCKTYYTFTISNQTLPIMYRPHIKVKI